MFGGTSSLWCLVELQVYGVNFGTANMSIVHNANISILKTAVSDRGSISLVFWCPYFESKPFSNGRFSKI